MSPRRPTPGADCRTSDTQTYGHNRRYKSRMTPRPPGRRLFQHRRNFIGAAGYDLNALRPDLAPFTFLLGNDDSTQLFSPDTAMNSVS